MKFKNKELYHILNCLCEQIELDYFNSEKGLTWALLDLINIVQYLGSCKCKHCRKGEKVLKKWLKNIRNKKSLFRLKE